MMEFQYAQKLNKQAPPHYLPRGLSWSLQSSVKSRDNEVSAKC